MTDYCHWTARNLEIELRRVITENSRLRRQIVDLEETLAISDEMLRSAQDALG